MGFQAAVKRSLPTSELVGNPNSAPRPQECRASCSPRLRRQVVHACRSSKLGGNAITAPRGSKSVEPPARELEQRIGATFQDAQRCACAAWRLHGVPSYPQAVPEENGTQTVQDTSSRIANCDKCPRTWKCILGEKQGRCIECPRTWKCMWLRKLRDSSSSPGRETSSYPHNWRSAHSPGRVMSQPRALTHRGHGAQRLSNANSIYTLTPYVEPRRSWASTDPLQPFCHRAQASHSHHGSAGLSRSPSTCTVTESASAGLGFCGGESASLTT